MTTATAPQSVPSSVSGLSDFTGTLKSRAEESAAKRTDTQEKKPDASAPANPDLTKETGKEKTEGTGKETVPAEKAEKAEKPVKTVEQLADELTSQAKANLRLGKELREAKKLNQELLETTKRLEAKFDGTHTESTPEETQNAQAKQAFEEYLERQNAGRPDIVGEVGEAEFVQMVEAENSKFRQIAVKKPHYARRIMEADNPAREAWNVTQEESVLEEFGTTRKSVLAKARDILREELFKEFETTKKPDRSPQAPTLRGSRPSGESNGNGAARPFSVSQMFKHTV